jgi:hypothetical protein
MFHISRIIFGSAALPILTVHAPLEIAEYKWDVLYLFGARSLHIVVQNRLLYRQYERKRIYIFYTKTACSKGKRTSIAMVRDYYFTITILLNHLCCLENTTFICIFLYESGRVGKDSWTPSKVTCMPVQRSKTNFGWHCRLNPHLR